jgi:hypothetical protein
LVESNESNKNGAHHLGKEATSFFGTLHQFVGELGE